jgi:hypothetical protein
MIMRDEYLDQRKHFRTPCQLNALCRIGGNRRPYAIRLIDINETGLAFSTDAELSVFKQSHVLNITVPAIRPAQSYDFEVKWARKAGEPPSDAVRVGARVSPHSAKDYALLVETIRHIQCWRELEQHVEKRDISMPEAIRRWRREHS